jgi:hypothetical protein
VNWNIERRSVPRLSAAEDVAVRCDRGHVAFRTRVLRGSQVTTPLVCAKCLERKPRVVAPKSTPEQRIAARVAKAGEHLARVAEKAARMEEGRKARQAREDRRARERVKAAERRAKAARLARQLLKLWESGKLPADLKAIVEAA